ncbi:MAG: hypothetical protein ACUVTN_01610 [Thermodesulfobacteriota bacterium]
MDRLRSYPKRLLWILYWLGFGVSLILGLLLLHLKKLHYHFQFQFIPEFFALFGFFGCMLLILIAKGMGFFIVKDENYYEKKLRR